jgi:threonine/homoserine/homoserine lactone efflux protein
MIVAAALLGFAFGFVGSIPVAGPIAVLVLTRVLEDRARSAMYLASGAAVAEGGYAYLAFWGSAELLTRYAWLDAASRSTAALILTGVGVHFLRRPRSTTAQPASGLRGGSKRSFLLGLTITALNPALLATWAAAVAALYSLGLLRFDPRAALPFSLGACAGITAWFATLLTSIGRFRGQLTRAALDRLVRAIGVLLVLLGLGVGVHLALRGA